MAANEFGTELRRLRTASGKTLRDLAADLEINYSYLSQLETGLARPSEDLARRIARHFKEDEERLLFLARGIPEVIDEIKKKYPNVAPSFFRKAGRPGGKK